MATAKTLYELFMDLPPKYDRVEQLLDTNTFTQECISESFCKFLEDCCCEYCDFLDKYGRKPLDEEIHSTYVFPLCELLLKHGLDPNYVFGDKNSESNVMYEIYWIDKPYVAADTLELLLEHGGNPQLKVDDEPIWQSADFDIYFDISYGYARQEDYRIKFDSRFHFWLVFRSFLSPEDMQYRKHFLYTYNLIEIDKSCWDIQVVPKQDVDLSASSI